MGFHLSDLKTPVDALGFRFHLGQQVVIALDVRAAGRSDLHKGKFALIGRIFFEEALDREKTLQDSFGVVDAIYADPEEGCFNSETAHQRPAFQIHEAVVGSGRGFVVCQVDADGEGPNQVRWSWRRTEKCSQSTRDSSTRSTVCRKLLQCDWM